MRRTVAMRYYVEVALLPIMYGLVWLVLGYGCMWNAIAIDWVFMFLGLLVFGPAWVAWHYYENKREQPKPQKL